MGKPNMVVGVFLNEVGTRLFRWIFILAGGMTPPVSGVALTDGYFLVPDAIVIPSTTEVSIWRGEMSQ